MPEEVISTLEQGLRTIRVNRPRRKNAYDKTVYTSVTNILKGDSQDDSVLMTVITGTGDFFSSGFDIKSAMAEGDSRGDSPVMEALKEFILSLITYPKILVGLINGPAIGIGFTSAVLMDILYCLDTAYFEAPFVGIGLCPEGCSSYTLPRLLGKSKANEILLLGKRLTALEARQLGLVSKVLKQEEVEELWTELRNYAAGLSVGTVKVIKRMITDHDRRILCECAVKELEQLQKCFESEEFIGAITRFMSKSSKL